MNTKKAGHVAEESMTKTKKRRTSAASPSETTMKAKRAASANNRNKKGTKEMKTTKNETTMTEPAAMSAAHLTAPALAPAAGTGIAPAVTAFGADSLPIASAPVVPASFARTSGPIPRIARPTLSQIAQATALATEMTTQTSIYTATLGPNAPSPAVLAAGLQLGYGWSQERAAAQAWYAYCQAQEARAWPPVLSAMSTIKPGLQYAASVTPSIAQAMPELYAFLQVRASIAKKAAASRKAGTSQADKAVAKAAQKVARAAAKKAPASSSTTTAAIAASTPAPVAAHP